MRNDWEMIKSYDKYEIILIILISLGLTCRVFRCRWTVPWHTCRHEHPQTPSSCEISVRVAQSAPCHTTKQNWSTIIYTSQMNL